MGSIKMHLRSNLMTRKDRYKTTESNLVAIDAAVIKASYLNKGGQKVVVLPRYCDLITLVSVDILKLASKNFNYEQDKENIAKYITKTFKTVETALLDTDNTLLLRLINGEKFSIALNSVDYESLIELAKGILVTTSSIIYSENEIKQFEKSLMQQLNEIDRGE